MSAALATVFGALADETRWSILVELGREPLSASALATRLPVSRQAIAKHLDALQAAGLVSSSRHGREVRYVALGARLTGLARELERIGAQWERRLGSIKEIAEELERDAPSRSDDAP